MQRQRGELVPVAEALADMPGPAKPLRDDSPQARRGFTVADQVNQLVWASEAAPARGFMARMMALCSLPRTNPRDRLRYVRRNGPYTLVMNAGGLYKLPFGHLPRLLMAWISTEAVRTQSRVLVLGDSLSDFMRELGIYSSDGKAYTRLRNQMERLFNASVRLIYEDKHTPRATPRFSHKSPRCNTTSVEGVQRHELKIQRRGKVGDLGLEGG